jgi:hypothetical protein
VLDAREVRDVDGCTSASSLLPLLAIETSIQNGAERQQFIDAAAACAVPPIYAPLFACRNGVATAYTDPVEGARYEWSAEGATILGGAGTNRVAVQIGEATVRLHCRVSTPECGEANANAAIVVREPIVVQELKVPATAIANQPVTFTWAYQPGREPQSQVLTGDLFPQPVILAAAQRSYTFTPQSGGSRTVELRASYAKTIPLAPPSKKRRRSVSGTVTASECPAALAIAKIDVQGCVQAEPVLDGPSDVAAGATFVVRVDIADGEKVQWSVENGTVQSVSPFYDYATFVAGTTGTMQVTARVERKPGCFATTSANIGILLPVEQCAVPPAALVTYTSHDCNLATVHATFTGHGPFAGEWSDGTEFRVDGPGTVHGFSEPGTYTIRSFRDSACFGTANSVTLEQFKAGVDLKHTSSCGSATLVATFKGVPPFEVMWSDGQKQTTNETALTRALQLRTEYADTWWVSVSDSACKTTAYSRLIEVSPGPQLSYGGYPVCQTTPGIGTWLSGYFRNGTPPYRLEWTDGVTAASASYSGVGRQIPPLTAPSATFELARAFAGQCELDAKGLTATVLNRPLATIRTPVSTAGCTTEPLNASLEVIPAGGATITWSAPYGRILSGQGTPSITFTADAPATVDVTVRTDFPDTYCSQTSAKKVSFTFVQRRTIRNIRLEPATIPPGGKATISWEADGTDAFLTAFSRSADLHQSEKCCSAYFLDTVHAAATVPISVSWYDPCAGYQQQVLTLTIAP